MNPLTLALGLGGGLATLLGGRKEINFADLEKMFGAQALGRRTQDIYSLLASSPAFRATLGRTNVQGQQLGQNINANLARSGLDTSGIGAVASGLGEAAGGFAQNNLIGNLYDTAANKATDLNSLLANLYLGTRQQGATPLQTLGGSVLGAVGPAFLRRPAGGNNGAPSLSGNWNPLDPDQPWGGGF